MKQQYLSECDPLTGVHPSDCDMDSDAPPTAADLHIRLRRIDDLKRANTLAMLDHQVSEAEYDARRKELGTDELATLSELATFHRVPGWEEFEPLPW